jgi:hypothetical protein
VLRSFLKGVDGPEKSVRQGLKPCSFCWLFGTNEQLAEKGSTGGRIREKPTAGANACVDLAAFSARLKSCPDSLLQLGGVLEQSVKVCSSDEDLSLGIPASRALSKPYL